MTYRLRWCVEMETRCRIPIWWKFGRIQWHVIPEPRITLQGAATWWIHCHDSRVTCHIAGCKNSIRQALTSGGFRIVSDTLVLYFMLLCFHFSSQFIYSCVFSSVFYTINECLSLQHKSWSSSCKAHGRSFRSSLHPWPCPSDEPQSSVVFGEDG